MVFFRADFVIDLHKQTPCTGEYGRKIESKTQFGVVSISFFLLIDFFLGMPSEIALGFVSTRSLCFLPSPQFVNDFIVTGSVCPVCWAVSNTVQDETEFYKNYIEM
jgi:hypothetical protein